MSLKWPLMTFKWPWDQKPLHHCVSHGETAKSCPPFYSLTLIIFHILMKIQLKTLKMTKNDLEMTLKWPKMTLRSKITIPLCCPWKNLQKLSCFLSSNSYNLFFIDEIPVFGSMNSHTHFKQGVNVQKKSHPQFFGR